MFGLFKKILCNDPEIIAVLCTYNESLNICGCIKHLEKYVDKIIIFDDGSTDETVSLAKKYKKVAKIIKNPDKKNREERKNREVILNNAYKLSRKKNPWALCVDADERFEINFLQDLKKIAKKHSSAESVIGVRFRELWDSPLQYRSDGIWDTKQKFIFFKLAPKMTFQYTNEHHIPWYYSELSGKEFLTDYNLYHLKMIKPKDRQKRVDLYNRLDPNKIMQPIGYDYLTDLKGLRLTKVGSDKRFDIDTVPEYYFK